MKPLHALIIPLLSTQLIYAEIKDIIIPNNIQTKLCQKLSKQECNQQQTLAFGNAFKLDNNRILFFSHLEREDSLYSHGYKNIPIIVDMKNNWQIINHSIEAEIQNVLRDPYGGIWVHALWMIEGVSPLLYYSKDGYNWKRITLPKDDNNHGTFEDLEICFLKESIQLRFNNLDNTDKTKIWEGKYKLVIDKNSLWEKINKKEISNEKCSKTLAVNNNWKLSKGSNKKVFLTLERNNNNENNNIITPTAKDRKNLKVAMQTTHFSIQLGTFKHKDSIDTLYTQMNNIPNTIIQREFISNGETVHKLFIGYFIAYDEAKNELSLLREKYPNNKVLKNAFITKLK